jgi:hypothetical protein
MAKHVDKCIEMNGHLFNTYCKYRLGVQYNVL